MFKLIALFAIIGVSNGHHCLLSPPQRTPLVGINKMMAPACHEITGPCGNTTASVPNIEYRAGSLARIVFEKNMAHYDAANPGYYSISIGQESGSLRELRRFTDPGDKAIFIYSVDVAIPADLDPSTSYILQVKHVTHRDSGPAILYQCADVGIFKTSGAAIPVGM